MAGKQSRHLKQLKCYSYYYYSLWSLVHPSCQFRQVHPAGEMDGKRGGREEKGLQHTAVRQQQNGCPYNHIQDNRANNHGSVTGELRTIFQNVPGRLTLVPSGPGSPGRPSGPLGP